MAVALSGVAQLRGLPHAPAAYEPRSLGVASHWPFESWGRVLPEHTTAVALFDRLLHHSVTVVTSGDSCRMKEPRSEGVGPPTTP